MSSNYFRSSLKPNRVSILDPMRFIAALFVVLYHYSIYLDSSEMMGVVAVFNYGYLGVPFFFILSGFVIAASAEKRSVYEFAVARVARLYPAFWASLAFTVGVSALIGGDVFTISGVLANATILNDYIGIDNIDGVYWTLQAELKFYGCVMLLILFGWFTSYRIWLTLWLILSILYYYSQQPFFMGMFIHPAYSFFFIGGVCCHLLYKDNKNYFALIVLGFAAVFSMLVGYSQVEGFYPSANSIAKIYATAIIGVFYIFFISLAYGKLNIKSKSWFKISGAVSYPLYLVHNRAGKEIIDYLSTSMDPACSVGLTILLMIVVSVMIHLCFEKHVSPLILNLGVYLRAKSLRLLSLNAKA